MTRRTTPIVSAVPREPVAPVAVQPQPDCRLCPRLAEFRDLNRTVHPTFFNAPVPSFGDGDATLLIAGLAPGLKGANRTGRPFTGDYAGDLLYGTLLEFGFARGRFAADPGDGLELIGCRIANAVRCVPPENKPTPAEVRTCNHFLRSEIAALPRLRAIVALGRIAHDAVLDAVGAKRSRAAFAHGGQHVLPGGITLFDSYHCSRYNTNTGRLTAAMFQSVFAKVAQLAAPAAQP